MIKLYKLESLEDGRIRLQSQLLVGSDTADFILEEGVLKCYGKGAAGFGFYPYAEPYEIVNTKQEMQIQKL